MARKAKKIPKCPPAFDKKALQALHAALNDLASLDFGEDLDNAESEIQSLARDVADELPRERDVADLVRSIATDRNPQRAEPGLYLDDTRGTLDSARDLAERLSSVGADLTSIAEQIERYAVAAEVAADKLEKTAEPADKWQAKYGPKDGTPVRGSH